MSKKLFSVVQGPIVDGKPSKVNLVIADSFSQVAMVYEDSSELYSIQLLPDDPVILPTSL